MSRNRADLTTVNTTKMTKRKLTSQKKDDNSKLRVSIHGFDARVSGKSSLVNRLNLRQ